MELDGKRSLCVSQAAKKEIMEIFDRWVRISPLVHHLYRYPMGPCLTLTKALHLLNHILGIMYDIAYERQGNRKQSDSETFFMYALRGSKLFSERLEGERYDQTKPSIEPWLTQSLPNLRKEDLVELQGGIIQPGREYSRRQGARYSSRDLPGIKDRDLVKRSSCDEALPPTKRKKP